MRSKKLSDMSLGELRTRESRLDYRAQRRRLIVLAAQAIGLGQAEDRRVVGAAGEGLAVAREGDSESVRFGSDGNGIFVALLDGGVWRLYTRAKDLPAVLTPEAERYIGGGSMRAALDRLRGYFTGEWGIP